MKPPWPFLLAFALIFYAYGAAFLESFVNYPSWRLIGTSEFIPYHRFISPRVIAFLVVPALSATILTGVMVKYRPAAIPLWSGQPGVMYGIRTMPSGMLGFPSPRWRESGATGS